MSRRALQYMAKSLMEVLEEDEQREAQQQAMMQMMFDAADACGASDAAARHDSDAAARHDGPTRPWHDDAARSWRIDAATSPTQRCHDDDQDHIRHPPLALWAWKPLLRMANLQAQCQVQKQQHILVLVLPPRRLVVLMDTCGREHRHDDRLHWRRTRTWKPKGPPGRAKEPMRQKRRIQNWLELSEEKRLAADPALRMQKWVELSEEKRQAADPARLRMLLIVARHRQVPPRRLPRRRRLQLLLTPLVLPLWSAVFVKVTFKDLAAAVGNFFLLTVLSCRDGADPREEDRPGRDREDRDRSRRRRRGTRGKKRAENEYWRKRHPEDFPPRPDPEDDNPDRGHGPGPTQWLLRRFPTQEDSESFRAALKRDFPMMASVDYVQPALLGGRQRCHVHVAMLSFQPERSTKGFPYRCTCKDLLDEYLVHGFLTEAEPLLLWSSPDDKQLRQEDFQCRYVKGMARCSTLLWLLASMADLKIEIMAHFPHLYQTIQVIHGLFECHPDLTSVAIANAHYSNRGSIRAPHDVLTWVTKLMLLDKAGAGKTPSQILEAYNQNASAKGKVNGQRRWNQILTVTETSFCVFVESLNVQQLSKSSRSRKPLDKGRLEEHAQMCSFWCWATQGAMEHAVDQEKLDSLTEKFKTGDVAMTLDVQSLLHERKHDIQWKCLRDLKTEATTCTDLAVVGHARTEIEAAKFEKAEFDLVSQKLKSDIQAVLIFRSKQESHESLIYHAKMDHQRKRRMHGKESTATLFAGPQAMFSFVTSVETMLANLCALKREHRLQQPLLVLVVVNWAAPSIVREEQMAQQMQALHSILSHEDLDAMGLILMPVWERSKGSMHKSESLLLENLSDRDVNTDDKASLSFEDYDRADPRDRRPLEYPLRLAFPLKPSQPQSAWHKSALYVNNRTSARATMLQARDMRMPEYEEDLPTSDVEQRVNPGEKYAQIGDMAAEVLLSSTAATLPSGSGPCVAIVDLSPKTGDFARAMLRMPMASVKMHYIALGQLEWAKSDLHDIAMERFLGRTLKINGMEPLPEAMAAEERPQVSLPKLNLGTVDGVNLKLPQSLHGEWSSSSFKDEWATLIEEMNQVIPEKSLGEPASKRMRRSEPEIKTEPSAAFSELVSIETLDVTKMLLQAPGCNKLKGLTFQVYPGNAVYLLNTTAADIPVTGNITGWQKGKWWQPKEVADEFDSAVDLVWRFADSSEVVLMDGNLKTIFQVIDEIEQQKPNMVLYLVQEYELSCTTPGAWFAELDVYCNVSEEKVKIRFRLAKEHFAKEDNSPDNSPAAQ
eukprot:s3790_g9.t1